MIEDLEDSRRKEPPFVLGEREMLEAWLEFHRTTLLLKCEGLDDVGRTSRPVPTSKLSLHGLVRHMAEVERNWFCRVLLRESDAPFIWRHPAVEDRNSFHSMAPTGKLTLLRGRPGAMPVGRQPRRTSSTTPVYGMESRAR